MIRLVLPARGRPNQVKLLAQYDDGHEVDVVKAGMISSITLRVVPEQLPELTVVFNSPEVDVSVDSGPAACGMFPPFTGEGILQGSDEPEHG